MAAYSQSDKLNLIQEILRTSDRLVIEKDPTEIQKLEADLVAELTNLDALQHTAEIASFIQNIHQPGIHGQLQFFLNNQFNLKTTIDIGSLLKNQQQANQKVASTIDSHNLQQILDNQKTAVQQLTQLNQLRNAVKNGVTEAILSDPAFAQAKDLLAMRSVQAELDNIINSVSLDPHKDINSLSQAIAEGLLKSNDRRLRTLVKHSQQLSDREKAEDFFNKKITQDPKAIEAAKLTLGKDSNQIRDALKAAIVADGSTNQPQLKNQLASILKDANITDPALLKNIETHLLTHASVTTNDAQAILESQFGTQTFRNLSADTQIRLINAFVANFEAASMNKQLASLRSDIVSEGIDAETLNRVVEFRSDNEYTVADMITTAYQLPEPAPVEESANDLARIDHMAANPQELLNPANQQFLNMRVSTSEAVQIWRSYYHDAFTPTISRQFSFFPPNYSPTFIWTQHIAPRVQGFNQGAHIFFEPLGRLFGSGGNLGQSSSNPLAAPIRKGLGGLFDKGKQLGKKVLKSLLDKAAKDILINLGKAALTSVLPYILLACGFIFIAWLFWYFFSPASPNFMLATRTMAVPVAPSDGFTFSSVAASCSAEKQRLSVPQPNSPIASRGWELVDDLYQGFWCYWNRPPFPEKIKGDVCDHPRCYSNYFDYDFYATNKDPDPNSTPNLFWCTYLIMKSYEENGIPLPADNAGANNMKIHFAKNAHYMNADEASSSNIKPGYVIFFHTYSDRGDDNPEYINHVAMVAAVNGDDITFIQSNGATKEDHITLNRSGGAQNLPWAAVKGFGYP